MSQEIGKKIRQMDLSKIENQFIFQCAPLIARLKMSNLFVIQEEHLHQLNRLLQKSKIHCRILYQKKESLTVLLYHPSMLAIYLQGQRARMLLCREGYDKLDLESVLSSFTNRYRQYRMGIQSFPHELGLLLGYPLDDVEGFIKNSGKNSLYTGYWKVYANVPAKRHLFRKYECAREDLLERVMHGAKLEQVLLE